MTVDPVLFEVIRNALVAATDEMALTLKRSAYSTNIKTRSDFSCAFFDRELRAVAQGFAQPVHLGSMVEQVPQAVRSYGAGNLGPGDVIVTNDPHPSGVHLNDVSLISPVHHEGELLGYVANLAHHVDVGGGAPASIGAFREVFQEGVIIPPVKLVEGGRIDLAASCTGLINPKQRLSVGDQLAVGDVIVLLDASGIHAKGLMGLST